MQHENLEAVMMTFREEVEEATKALISIVGYDTDLITRENSKEFKEKFNKEGYKIENMYSSQFPLRTYLRLHFKEQPICGWVVYLDLKLSIVKRVLIENEGEEEKALLFLSGQGDSFSLERDGDE